MSEQLDEATKTRITAQNEAGAAKSEFTIIEVHHSFLEIIKTIILFIFWVTFAEERLPYKYTICRCFTKVNKRNEGLQTAGTFEIYFQLY